MQIKAIPRNGSGRTVSKNKVPRIEHENTKEVFARFSCMTGRDRDNIPPPLHGQINSYILWLETHLSLTRVFTLSSHQKILLSTFYISENHSRFPQQLNITLPTHTVHIHSISPVVKCTVGA